MNRPEAERAVVEMLSGVYRIVIIAVHPEPNTIYPFVELTDGNKAKFVKVNDKHVCYYKEVENACDKRSGLFR